ncbi:hypothetical protein [Amycolatopsis alba]|uniref:Uncharacterized protein n=1 Tax=Amycolatopsis alba DSM 44262 TaxID=1125972 RepID=A0A229RG67_AMYAL|nr:hypothetical protein [Amycolatopsis alba]OXM45630.1 hypothetical protein CFP75_30335 [Amycolatopsis alba DSM 44262]
MTWLSLNGDDVADMDPDATGSYMGNLRGAAADLRDGWTRDNNRMVAATQIGDGPLGKAFTELLTSKDQPASPGKEQPFLPDKAREAAATVPGFYVQVAELGELLVTVYVAHDSEAAAAIWSSVR